MPNGMASKKLSKVDRKKAQKHLERIRAERERQKLKRREDRKCGRFGWLLEGRPQQAGVRQALAGACRLDAKLQF